MEEEIKEPELEEITEQAEPDNEPDNEPEETRELITSVVELPAESVAPEPPMEASYARFLTMAVEGNLDVEVLKQLIDLKNREEERASRKEFDIHFAAMQSEFAPAKRRKQGDKHKYAPIEDLQKQYKTSITDHGFSYRWSEDDLEDGGLRVIMTISGYGYSTTNHKDLPRYAPEAKIMNALQAEGTRTSYGRRYTFISGFGITIEDEDTDGTFEDGVEYGEMVRAIDAETNIVDLHGLVKGFRADLKSKGDQKGVDIVTKAYGRRREGLI